MLIKVYKCTLFEKAYFPKSVTSKLLDLSKVLDFTLLESQQVCQFSWMLAEDLRLLGQKHNAQFTIYSNNRAEYQHFSRRFLSPGSRRAVLTQPGDSLCREWLALQGTLSLGNPHLLWWAIEHAFPLLPEILHLLSQQ